jgi:hypothetical protein
MFITEWSELRHSPTINDTAIMLKRPFWISSTPAWSGSRQIALVQPKLDIKNNGYPVIIYTKDVVDDIWEFSSKAFICTDEKRFHLMKEREVVAATSKMR